MFEFIKTGSLPILILVSLIVGSILGHWIYYLTKQKSQKKVYKCVQCSSPIRPWENIPVLSYIVFPGRCRVCSWPIKPRQLTGEFIGITVLLIITLLIRFNT